MDKKNKTNRIEVFKIKFSIAVNLKTKILIAMLCISVLPLICLANLSIAGIEQVGVSTREEGLKELKDNIIDLQLQKLANNSKYINLELQRIYDQVSACKLITEGLYSKNITVNNIAVDENLVKDKRGFYWNPINEQDNSTVFISSNVVMHSSWRLANCRRRRQFQGYKKVGIFAVKVEKPSLVSVNKEMASSSFAA